ncbi:MAG: DUF2059 domain-containing protein [Polaromonas sp.]|nr:MAG: DUF2059 domain-containing protein [Polaromonas sp.]
MKNILSALGVVVSASLLSMVVSTAGQAQIVDPKLAWATKVVALQQGPELNRLIDQLANSTAQDLLQKWGPKVQLITPKTKQAQITEELNTELRKYSGEVAQLIGNKVGRVSADALIPAYTEKFTLEELQQITGFFESPAIKKYQASAPELGSIFIQRLVEATRGDVSARAAQFDESAVKILGTGAASKSAPTAPAPSNNKPAAKK